MTDTASPPKFRDIIWLGWIGAAPFVLPVLALVTAIVGGALGLAIGSPVFWGNLYHLSLFAIAGLPIAIYLWNVKYKWGLKYAREEENLLSVAIALNVLGGLFGLGWLVLHVMIYQQI